MKSRLNSRNSVAHKNILALDVGEHLIGVAIYLSSPYPHSDVSSSKDARTESEEQLQTRWQSPTENAGNALERGVSLPLTPIVRSDGSLGLGTLRRLIQRFNLEDIVVGLPNLPPSLAAGTAINQAPKLENLKKIKGYVGKLKKHFPAVKIITLDEAYTTWVVKDQMPRVKKEPTAAGIDSLAALEILKSYLNQYVYKNLHT